MLREQYYSYNDMPKVVDNYVLERKIGSGQFGDVFKGVQQAKPLGRSYQDHQA